MDADIKFWMQNQILDAKPSFLPHFVLTMSKQVIIFGHKRKTKRKKERKYDKLTEFLRMSKHIEVSKGLMNKGVD